MCTQVRGKVELVRPVGIPECLAGALVGGLLFRLLRLWPGLDQIAISLRDVVSAFIGSMLVLVGLWAWQRWKPSP